MENINIITTSWTNPYYSLFFYNLVKEMHPDLCVELGTLAGYSAYCISSALKKNGHGHLECWDLWENYKYNHVPLRTAENNLKGLPVILYNSDAFKAHENYRNGSVDLLMVDLSNDGDTYSRILHDWYPKLSEHSKVLMEGGTEERDNIKWMKDYNKRPILDAIMNDEFILSHYNNTVLVPFPGLTVFEKKPPEERKKERKNG